MRVLVVEDHLLIQQSLALLLGSQPDITVVGGASSIREAVTQARQHKPDCILMDVSLLEGKGQDAAQAILAEQPTIKIVLIITHDYEGRKLDAIPHGMHSYLPKHITSTQLLEHLRAVMQSA